MKLKYILKGKEKKYTLKENKEYIKTSDAHYKFIKIKDAPKND